MRATYPAILLTFACQVGGLGLRTSPPEIESTPPSQRHTMLDLVSPTNQQRLEVMAMENVKYLRNQIAKMENVVTEDTNTNKLARGLVVSILMLVVIAVAATVSIRPLTVDTKSGRKCPLEIILPDFCRTADNEKPVEDQKIIDDYPIDWGTLVLASNKFKCVLDPKTVTIERLLSTPPPTFIRKDGGVSEQPTMNVSPKYVTVSE